MELTPQQAGNLVARVKDLILEAKGKGVPFIVKWPVEMRLELSERDDLNWPALTCVEGPRKYIIWGSLPLEIKKIEKGVEHEQEAAEVSFLKDAIGFGVVQEDKTEELDKTSGEWHTVRKELGYEDSDGDLRVFKHQGCQ